MQTREKIKNTLPIVSILLFLSCYFVSFGPGIRSVSDPIAGQRSISVSSVYDCVFGEMSNFHSILGFVLLTFCFVLTAFGVVLILKGTKKSLPLPLLLLGGLTALVLGVYSFFLPQWIKAIRVTLYLGEGYITISVICFICFLLNMAYVVMEVMDIRKRSLEKNKNERH